MSQRTELLHLKLKMGQKEEENEEGENECEREVGRRSDVGGEEEEET